MYGNHGHSHSNGPYKPFAQYASAMSTPSATSISEIVTVPPDLSLFAGNPQFYSTLLKVKDQSGITTINVRRNVEDGTKAESIEIGAPTADSAMIARKLVETHFVNQIKLNAKSRNLQKVQTELFSVQGEMASGTVAEFNVDVDLVGLVIGAKGTRIKQVEAETGTKANVEGKTGRIIVSGPDNVSVQKAKELLDLKEQRYPLKPEQMVFLSRYPYDGSLGDIRDQCGLLVARIDKDQLLVVGPQSAITFCTIILPTQLEYVDKQISVEGEQRLAVEQLRGIQKQFGGGFARRDGGSSYDRRDQRDSRDVRVDPRNLGRTGAISGPSSGRGGGAREAGDRPRGLSGNGNRADMPPRPPSKEGKTGFSGPSQDRQRTKAESASVTAAAAGLARATLADTGMLPEKKPRERGPRDPKVPAAPAPAPETKKPEEEKTSPRKRGARPPAAKQEGEKAEKSLPTPPVAPAASTAKVAPDGAASAAAAAGALEKRTKKPREPRERGPKQPKTATDAGAANDTPAAEGNKEATRITITEGSLLKSFSVFSAISRSTHSLISFHQLTAPTSPRQRPKSEGVPAEAKEEQEKRVMQQQQQQKDLPLPPL